MFSFKTKLYISTIIVLQFQLFLKQQFIETVNPKNILKMLFAAKKYNFPCQYHL